MKSSRFVILTSAALFLGALSLPAAAHTAPGFKTRAPLRVDALHGSLNSVAIFGPHLAWAIGTTPKGDGVDSLVERWDGESWRQVAVPAEPGHDAGFGSIAGSSPHDIWALGSYGDGPKQISFADHWDGRTWSKVPFPNPPRAPFGSIVQGLSVVSAADVWASGLAGLHHAWVVHWNGAAWTRIPGPNFAGQWGTQAWGISAFSRTDAWITGVVRTPHGSSRTMAAHWDGTSWTRFSTPNVPHVEAVPWRMSASSPDNIWAAGYTNDPHDGSGGPFLMHWDGATWSLPDLPPTDDYSSFYDVSTASTTDAWAVGYNGADPLAMHWDGTTWSIESPSAPGGELVGVADYSTHLAIAVGSARSRAALHEIWDGTSWH